MTSSSKVFALFCASFSVIASAQIRPDGVLSGWLELDIPSARQTSQIDAGYPMGCQMTAIVYALKFGPSEWRSAYSAIQGSADALKIRSLAEKFSAMKSRADSAQPAFSEKFGMNPNDLPWMFESLVPGESQSKLEYFIDVPEPQKPAVNELEKFRTLARERLGLKKPVLLGL